jgi:hypothetical protein
MQYKASHDDYREYEVSFLPSECHGTVFEANMVNSEDRAAFFQHNGILAMPCRYNFNTLPTDCLQGSHAHLALDNHSVPLGLCERHN